MILTYALEMKDVFPSNFGHPIQTTESCHTSFLNPHHASPTLHFSLLIGCQLRALAEVDVWPEQCKIARPNILVLQ